MYQEFVASKYTPDEVPDELYNTYLALAEIPKKDWGKASTLEAVQEATQEQVEKI